MQGKVFADSLNLYQDEAKILFNYYKKAAEKIVKEETALEESIGNSKAIIELNQKARTRGLVISIVFPAAALLSTLAVFLVLEYFVFYPLVLALGAVWGIVTIVKARKTIDAETEKIAAFEEAFKEIRRDYHVKKLGVLYVPVAGKIPFEDKSFMVDYAGTVENTNFTLSAVRQPGELLSSLKELEKGISEIPMVETASDAEETDTADYSTSIQNITMYDYMGNIDRQVRNISYLLRDNDTLALSLPVILPKSDSMNFIREYGADETGNNPVVNVFNIDGFKEKIGAFYSLNSTKKDFEKNTNENQIIYFKKLIARLAESVPYLCQSKISGSAKITEYGNKIFAAVLKSAFNHYSPALEAEEIERIRTASFDYQESVDDYTPFALKSSSRVKYDIFSGSWIAEDQSRTTMPFGMHQIQEEIFMPVIQNLMAENRVERLRIYNNIQDQKRDYLNQWHRDTEDFYGRNRAQSADVINLMRETYADWMASFNTYKALQETQNSMKESHTLDAAEVQEQDNAAEDVIAFEAQAVQHNRKQEEFTEYMDRIHEDINAKAAQFGYVEYYEASLRDAESRDFARSTEGIQELDPRRKKLLVVNPYMAKYAKLPPPPRVEQKLYDDLSINLKSYSSLEEDA
jgi:hypothetical protein